MATITLRLTKGSPLTFIEADNNFSNLNNEKIERTGSIDFTGAQSFVAGTAAAPGIRFVGDTNTGIFSPGADQLAFTTAGVYRGYIGTTGSWTVDSPSSGPTLTLGNSPSIITYNGWGRTLILGVSSAVEMDSGVVGAGRYAFFGTTSDGNFYFGRSQLNDGTTAPQYALSITSASNVRIYTPASGEALTILGGHIRVGSYANPRIFVANNSGIASEVQLGADSGNGFVGTSTGTFYVISEGATRLQFNAGGQGQFNAGLLVTGGRLQASDTLEVSGSATLASSYGSTIALAAGMAGSVSRLFIGDGSGWVFRFSRRSGGVTTDRLEIHDNAQLRAFSGASTDPSSVAFSTTPTFDARNSNVFYFGTLTGNVTSMTISQPTDGQTIQIRFVQDGAGSKTVALPAGAVVSGSINPAANAVTWLVITYVSSASRWEGTWTRVS